MPPIDMGAWPLCRTGRTRVAGVFGWPIGHSVSPAMHNAAFAATGLDWVYVPFPVAPQDLPAALAALAPLGIAGVNLTVPHKQAAAALVDSLEPEARAAGAVNTVTVRDAALVGDNTDGPGFLASLRRRGVALEGATAVVLGAGGAARGVAVALARSGCAVRIANRTPDRAVELARVVSALGNAPATAAPIDSPALADGAALVVNATSAGMSPNESAIPAIDTHILRPGLLVYDLVYAPARTRLLEEAANAGCETEDGLAMLAEQGAAAFRIWTGVDAPVGVMMDAARQALQAG